MLYEITLEEDPMAPEGVAWYRQTITLLDKMARANPGMQVWVAEGASTFIGMYTIALTLFPWVVGGTLCMALVCMAVAFRSLLMPLTSLLMAALSLASIYGLAFMVYGQD